MKHRVATLLLAFVTAFAGGSVAFGNGGYEEMTYEDLVKMYGGWTRRDVEMAAYRMEEFCVDAASAGLAAEMGGMGFHAIAPPLIGDGGVDPDRPEAFLLDAEGNVIGVEYRLLKVVDEPLTVAAIEQPLQVTPPLPGVDQEHMSLHVYFVGDEEHRYSTWNPAVTCPAGSTLAPPAMLPKTGAVNPFVGNLVLLLAGGMSVLLGGGLYLLRGHHDRQARLNRGG